ncbi:MAG TPA: DNA repair protein RecN [Candidatus Scatomorpha intestinigallinarum]|uniref:DNA repair protein RecN n=1 Tax=Candidatus Scatomorpha intestinigallinarum TaxID=2840923 RepID=A0A9D1DMV2_9FIRM|nr:DNA repair protein RecN [Candidatus Scatomorpha intestinigallinarum]
MLTELHIENIAVIERADIEPGPGLNVLTGETGAGKSIVIDSLEAILGARASRELVRTGAQNAAVSAVFDDERAARWLVEHDLEPVGQYDPDTGEGERIVIRRRISAEGKSSALVNGENVTAAELRQLGALLLDIHGQNDGRQLMDETRHRDYLDGFAGLAPQLERQGRLYEEYRQALSALRKLEMTEAERERREREYRMTADELAAANIRPGEEEQLLARRELLRNSEKLTEALDAAYEALYGGEDSAAEQAGNASGWTERAASLAPELEEALAEIESARASIEDAAERLRDFRESLDFSPGEYDALETRLSQLRRLEKKYGADEAGLAALLEAAQRGLEELDGSEEKRRELEAELAKRKKAAYNSAKELSQLRRAAGEELRQRVEQGLRELSMPSVRFETEIVPLEGEPGFDATGMDEVRFLMSANAGEAPGRISKIASGGELARIMLVMKDVLSERDGTPAMVFDEIDEGVSGVAAQRVAEKLARLSKKKQVICVTHLPQIAAMADTHFRIEKTERDGRTYTKVTPLEREGRIRELARLHGGANITDTTLASAAEQLDAASEYKGGI